MARSPKGNAAALKAATKADATIGTKGRKAPAKASAKAPAKAAAPVKAATEKKRTKAVVFRELIMGNATAKKPMTDAQIFEAARKEFPDLDDGKASYVKWYRNDLAKKGENPPAPVA